MKVCGDPHTAGGVIWFCDQDPDHTPDSDHQNTRCGITWFQHPTGARWTIRHQGGFLWHRITTSKMTACGLVIKDLTPRTVKGRTRAVPPGDALVCPACLAVAPWVPVGLALVA